MSDPATQQVTRALAERRFAEAEQICLQILSRDNTNRDAMRLLGGIYGQTRRLPQAAEIFQRCITLQEDDGEARMLLGMTLQSLNQPEAALAHLMRAIELLPHSAQARYNFGKLLRDQKRNEDAANQFRQCLTLQPGFPPALNNLANTLRDLGRSEQAIPVYQAALVARPNHPPTLHNLGLAYRDLQMLDDAMRCFDTALAYDSSHHECRLSRAMLLIQRGHFLPGWNEYEARFDVTRANARRDFEPRWDGQNPEGQTLLLYAEQGFGDAIQFSRYATLLAERHATVVVHCQPELAELFQSLRGVDQIITTGDALPKFDACRGMMSMPLVFGTTLESVPNETPYLRADQAKVRRWRRIIEPGGIRVGLVWAGAAGYGNDRQRSLTLENFSPILRTPDVQFFSLQKGAATEQIAQLPAEIRPLNLSAELNNFADTAAAIENLDLVISVDTAVAHLAGALDKPVWTMIPFAPDWRWMSDREETPWYPTMRLFRQKHRGDWGDVITNIAEALKTFST
jgi:tetratricopeptide (TPR) repeat protein